MRMLTSGPGHGGSQGIEQRGITRRTLPRVFESGVLISCKVAISKARTMWLCMYGIGFSVACEDAGCSHRVTGLRASHYTF
jgi:hypothetical protein